MYQRMNAFNLMAQVDTIERLYRLVLLNEHN